MKCEAVREKKSVRMNRKTVSSKTMMPLHLMCIELFFGGMECHVGETV